MSNTFTPGPWEVDGFHMSAVIVRDGAGWRRVAECDSDGFRNPNWKADARAVSAVPEMIEALRPFAEAWAESRVFVQADGKDYSNGYLVNAVSGDDFKRAFAALAKVSAQAVSND